MSIASIRPDGWNFPLFVHVLGAMVLVGLLAAVVVLLVVSLRAPDRAATLRLAFRTTLVGAIPAYIVMRIGAEWIADKENVPDDLSWIGIGYTVADAGLLVLIVVTVLAGLAARRAGRGPDGGGLIRPTAGLTLLLIAAMRWRSGRWRRSRPSGSIQRRPLPSGCAPAAVTSATARPATLNAMAAPSQR